MTFMQTTRRAMQLALVGAALASSLPALAAPPTPAALATAGEIV